MYTHKDLTNKEIEKLADIVCMYLGKHVCPSIQS
jgi:hypothetical protein